MRKSLPLFCGLIAVSVLVGCVDVKNAPTSGANGGTSSQVETQLASPVSLPSDASSSTSSNSTSNTQDNNSTVTTRVHWAIKGASTPPGVAPQALCDAYQLDCADSDGSGETIAVIDAFGSPTIQADLAAFDQEFDYLDPNLQVVSMGGTGTDAGWALETSLDVEWAHAMAPGANLLLVVAKTGSTSDLISAVQKAVSLGANEISMSWGQGEIYVADMINFSLMSGSDAMFNVPGVSFFASAGDQGTGVLWPASSPYVVGVGGTSFTIGANEVLTKEVAWSHSGGGVSHSELKPAFQNGFVSGTMRGVPDVAYYADDAYPIYCNKSSCGGGGNWQGVGGTSVGPPQWAAIFAVANSRRGPTHRIQSAPEAIYHFGQSNGDFTDIISGRNCLTSSCDPTYTTAYAGYDYITGLGSPAGKNLIPDLIGF